MQSYITEPSKNLLPETIENCHINMLTDIYRLRRPAISFKTKLNMNGQATRNTTVDILKPENGRHQTDNGRLDRCSQNNQSYEKSYKTRQKNSCDDSVWSNKIITQRRHWRL